VAIKNLFAKALDVLCSVVGPVCLVRGGLSFSPRFGYESASLDFMALGVGLLAFGPLRIFWARKSNRLN
jgi:hypothetical protein